MLRRQDLRETSLILTFYTKGFGKIKGIVRGVRGQRPICSGGSFELFAHDEVVFYERKRTEFFTISQCDLVEFFNPVRESLTRLSYATYMAELLDSVTQLSDKNEDVFALLLNSLKLLSGSASPRRVARIFEIKLLDYLGIMPTLEQCVGCASVPGADARFSLRHGGLICPKCASSDKLACRLLPGTIKFMEYVRAVPFEKAANVKVAERVGRELEGLLRRFLDYHIERRLKTLDFIKAMEKVV